jgi:hypothetical protein
MPELPTAKVAAKSKKVREIHNRLGAHQALAQSKYVKSSVRAIAETPLIVTSVSGALRESKAM